MHTLNWLIFLKTRKNCSVRSRRYTCLYGNVAAPGHYVSSSLVRCKIPENAQPGRYLFNVVPFGSDKAIPFLDKRLVSKHDLYRLNAVENFLNIWKLNWFTLVLKRVCWQPTCIIMPIMIFIFQIHFTLYNECSASDCMGYCIGAVCVCPLGRDGTYCEQVSKQAFKASHFGSYRKYTEQCRIVLTVLKVPKGTNDNYSTFKKCMKILTSILTLYVELPSEDGLKSIRNAVLGIFICKKHDIPASIA